MYAKYIVGIHTFAKKITTICHLSHNNRSSLLHLLIAIYSSKAQATPEISSLKKHNIRKNNFSFAGEVLCTLFCLLYNVFNK